jgi:hypothetical protein
MSALTDFVTTLKGWVNRTDLADAVVVSWIRMGEERINNELLYKDMLTRERATFLDNCSPLPPDWKKVEYVKYVRDPNSTNTKIKYGRGFDFVSKDEYWRRLGGEGPYTGAPCYTIIGNDLFVTGDVDSDGVDIEIGVYRKVPPLDGANWLYNNHIGLYTFASLAASAPWLMEDERMGIWESKAQAFIMQMNETHLTDKTGGSPMKMKRKSFG